MSDLAYDPWGFDEVPETRAPRKLETRAVFERPRVWAPAAILPDPEPQDGWVFRWCRTEVRNKSDHQNYQSRLREGWEPVRPEDHPELMTQVGPRDARYNGIVEIGGLVLCKMTQEMADQRREYYAQKTRDVTDAAENSYLRDNDERMAKVQQKRRETIYGSRAR